jgi:proteasome lid subunit RPN8/RPN11
MLRIKTALLDTIKAHAEHSTEECCGFLFGYDTSHSRSITEIMAVPNVKLGDKRYNFEIAPKDYLHAEKYAEQRNLQLLGVYHSHPEHSAFPSEYDRAWAMLTFSYIIVSVINSLSDDVRSWRLTEDKYFEEEQIQVADSPCTF